MQDESSGFTVSVPKEKTVNFVSRNVLKGIIRSELDLKANRHGLKAAKLSF